MNADFFAQLGQHGQHVAGSAAGIRLVERVSLGAGPVAGEVDEKLAQGRNVNAFFHTSHRLLNHQVVLLYVDQGLAARLKGNGVGLLPGVDDRAGGLLAVIDKDLHAEPVQNDP